MSNANPSFQHLTEKVKRWIGQHRMWDFESPILAAVSGGPDSVAMFHLLVHLTGPAHSVGIVHVNHHARPESDDDAMFVRKLAERFHVPYFYHDLKPLQAGGISRESYWRECRYAFFQELTAKTRFQKIATGHTSDDQLETVLFRLANGTGPRGVLGIDPVFNKSIIRPLLCCTRFEIMSFIENAREPYRTDPSNELESIPRNFIRKNIVPLIRRINPQAHEHVRMLADLLREDDEYLSREALSLLDRAGWSGHSTQRFCRKVFQNQPAALLRRIALFALIEPLRKSKERMTRNMVVNVCAVLTGQQVRQELPGGYVIRRNGPWIYLIRNQPLPPDAVGPIPFPNEKETFFPGYVFYRYVHHEPLPPEPAKNECFIRADLGNLFIRARKPGDRIRLMDHRSEIKLKDLFNRIHIPPELRDRIPLIVDQNDRVVCVTGTGIAEFAVYKPDIREVLKITWKHTL